MLIYFVTLLDIICISTQIPSIYITVKAVRHLGSRLILFDLAILRLCPNTKNTAKLYGDALV